MSDQFDMKRVIDRIHAFLNMAQSPNEAEAATAMEMAHRMLKEHNLTMSQIAREEQGIKEDNYESYIEMPVWKDQLLMQICKTFYCDSYHNHFSDISKWVIVGRSDNVATVRIMADYLLQAIERWATRFDGEEEAKESYRTGIADMLRVRLYHMMKQENTEAYSSTALMVRETALVENYMAKKMEDEGGTKDDAPEFKIEDMLAYLKGQEDGKGISLATQIAEQTVSPRMALKGRK